MTLPGHRFFVSLFMLVIVAWLMVMLMLVRASALAPEATGMMLAVFEPKTTSDQAFAAIANAGGKPIRQSAFSFIWVVTGDEAGLAGKLKANGALGAYRELPINPTIAGCFAYADAKVSTVFAE
jgi:hypothetical protein